MSWKGFRSSGLSPGERNQEFHKTGGVVRTKVGRRPDEGSRKVLFAGMCASSGRRKPKYIFSATEVSSGPRCWFVRTKGRRPDDATLSSGRRAYGRIKIYGKNVFFWVGSGF